MINSVSAREPCALLPWDTDFWGFPIARLNAEALTPPLLADATEWCARHRVRCLYFLAAGSCPRTLALAATNEFRFVDVRVELSLHLTESLLPEETPDSSGIRPATQSDLLSLQELAAEAHRDTRFFKDERFNPARAAALYREWIARDFTQHVVLTCDTDTQLPNACGYVSCTIDATSGEGSIGLIAVASNLTGKGFGRKLVRGALRWFATQQVRTVRVVTQATNVAAMRLYEGNGFRTREARVWFHKWFASKPCS